MRCQRHCRGLIPAFPKKIFGHVLLIAGSPTMLGAAALCSLAAFAFRGRTGDRGCSQEPEFEPSKEDHQLRHDPALAQSRTGSFSIKAFDQISHMWDRFDALAVGPGLGRSLAAFNCPARSSGIAPSRWSWMPTRCLPWQGHTSLLLKAPAPRVLTPHAGEMARLNSQAVAQTEGQRLKAARDFARAAPLRSFV